MRTITRLTAVTIVALSAAGAAVLTSSAANAADSSTDAAASVNSGVLSISAPSSATFPAADPGTTSNANLSGVTVTDTRAGTVGWTTSVSVSDFTSASDPTRTIAASALTYTPSTAATTGTVTVAGVNAITASSAAQAVQTATNVTGNNTAAWNAALALAVPSDALAASDYTATLTHSVL
jgi:hypothetical protein